MTAMRIVSIAAQTLRWPIAGLGAARGRRERAAVVVEVRSDRGVIGLGEAAPLPGMSPDTVADAERTIAALARRVPLALADREAMYDLAAGAASPAARFAIETALLDALARDAGVSLAALFVGPVDRAPPSPAVTARFDAVTVPLAAVVDDPPAAHRAWRAGIRCLKIKLGVDDDPDRVAAIAAAAPGARLRIDANRSWPRGEVEARLAALSHLPIDYVEEPCHDAHLLLTGPLACPIALDESLVDLAPAALEIALGSPALAALVLKPTLLGGLAACLALAGRARLHGVAAIASHGLEGPIGTAACAELALALGADHAAGLAAHPALAGWSVSVPQLAPDHVHAAAGPGLGFADLDLATVVGACPPAD